MRPNVTRCSYAPYGTYGLQDRKRAFDGSQIHRLVEGRGQPYDVGTRVAIQSISPRAIREAPHPLSQSVLGED
jgi:hypothetical protein